MNTSNTQLPTHDAGRSYAELEIDGFEDLKSTKARLDKARQEVDRRYEALSKCHLDNMTCAKAQLDHTRQKEKDCYKEFDQVYKRVVAAISQHSPATRDPDVVEGEEDVSALGFLPKVLSRRIRAPTRASTRLVPQVAR